MPAVCGLRYFWGHHMTQSLLQEPVQSYEDSNGKPLNGGQLFSYSAGTLTPKATYTDAAGAVPNTNPIILNERGEATVYGSGNYRFILKNSVGATIWDRDNVSSAPSGTDLSGSNGASLIGFDGTTLDQQIKTRLNRVVDSIAALRGLDKTKYTRAFVTGYYAASDGGGGAYQLDPADTTSTDNSGTIIVASDGGRWKLQFTGPLSVKQFGAKGDGTTNDSAAFQACVDAIDPSGDIYVPEGTFVLNTAINIAAVSGSDSGLTIRGNGIGSRIQPGAAVTNLFNITGKNIRIEGIFFFNVSSFATAAITVATSSADAAYSARFAKNYIIGFTDGIRMSGQNYDVQENFFQNNGTHVRVTNDGRNSSFRSNYMLGGNNGMVFEKTAQQAEGVRIIDNCILVTVGSGAGISFQAGLDIFIGHNVIDQTGVGSVGIYMPVPGGNAVAKVKIVGNWIAAGQNSYSIFASGNNNEIHIAGNSIMSNNALAAAAGISLAGTNGMQVIGNNFGIVTGPDLSESGTSNRTIFGNTSSQGGSNVIANVTSQSMALPKLIISTNNLPTFTAGTGAPTAVEPVGSIFLRSDGGVGGHLYVSQGGGTWNPVAGV